MIEVGVVNAISKFRGCQVLDSQDQQNPLRMKTSPPHKLVSTHSASTLSSAYIDSTFVPEIKIKTSHSFYCTLRLQHCNKHPFFRSCLSLPPHSLTPDLYHVDLFPRSAELPNNSPKPCLWTYHYGSHLKINITTFNHNVPGHKLGPDR